MTPKEGFKYGFLLRCAEEGLTVKEAEARAARGLEKRGADSGWGVLGQMADDAYGFVKSVATGIPAQVAEWGPKALAGAGAGAAVGGAGLGYGLAKMQEGDIDPEEVQREELISAYRAQTELARRKAIMDAAQRTWARPKSYHGI